MDNVKIIIKFGNKEGLIEEEDFNPHKDYQNVDIYTATITVSNDENEETIKIHNGLKLNIREALNNIRLQLRNSKAPNRQSLEDLLTKLETYQNSNYQDLIVYANCSVKLMEPYNNGDRVVASKKELLDNLMMIYNYIASASVRK